MLPNATNRGSLTWMAYLISWVDGDSEQVSRPTSYQYLNLRRYEVQAAGDVAGRPWAKPHRFRVIHVLPKETAGDSDYDGEAGPLQLEDDQPAA